MLPRRDAVTEPLKMRWGVWFRFACGIVALFLVVIPALDQTRRLFHISTNWDQPSNYFLSAMAVAVLGLWAPHPALKPAALKLQRGLGIAICVFALVVAILALLIAGVMSTAMLL